jgi:hypothetical protein
MKPDDYNGTEDTILFNRKKLKKYNIEKLLKIAKKEDSKNKIKNTGTKSEVASVFIMKDVICCEKLKKLHRGEERIQFMNSDEFIENIDCCYNLAYSRKEKLCELRISITDDKIMEKLFKAIKLYLPSNTIVWTGLIPENQCDKYIHSGFTNPYICSESPLGYNFNKKGIAFVRYNTNSEVPKALKDNFDIETLKNKVRYVNEQENKKRCDMFARFAPETVEFFKRFNDERIYPLETQKELTGSLRVHKIVDTNGRLIFELHGDETSIEKGKDLEVDVVWSRFNFHSHPKKAYIVTGNVKYAWPSSQDFAGFLDLDEHTIFHTLVSLEGLYTISFHPSFKGDPAKINRNIILNLYNISHHENITPDEYIIKVNEIKYKGKNLFVVKYFSWENATQVFPIVYAKTEHACLATDNVFELYRKQYGDDDEDEKEN